MTRLKTTDLGEISTQSAPLGREVKVRGADASKAIATGSHAAVGSVPSDLPPVFEGEQEGYVFRIGGTQVAGSVTITINTNRLIERAKVRRLNHAMRRARRR